MAKHLVAKFKNDTLSSRKALAHSEMNYSGAKNRDSLKSAVNALFRNRSITNYQQQTPLFIRKIIFKRKSKEKENVSFPER